MDAFEGLAGAGTLNNLCDAMVEQSINASSGNRTPFCRVRTDCITQVCLQSVDDTRTSRISYVVSIRYSHCLMSVTVVRQAMNGFANPIKGKRLNIQSKRIVLEYALIVLSPPRPIDGVRTRCFLVGSQAFFL